MNDTSPPDFVTASRNHALRVAVLLFAMYLVAMLLWFASALVFVAFLGILFGLAVSTGVDILERYRLPRGVGAVSIVLGFFLLLVGAASTNMPTIRQQSRELREKVPESLDRLEQWLHKRGIVLLDTTATDSTGVTTRAAALRSTVENQVGTAAKYVFPFLSQTVAIVGGVMLIIFMAIYIGAEPEVYRKGVLLLVPLRMRDRAIEVTRAIALVLRKWLVTQLIAMVVIGIVSTIALLILDVQPAFALGLLAGLFEFIPTVGPLLAAIPAVAMGFLDSPEKALTVGLVYWGIQFLENNLLIPLLMKGGVNVPPVVTILGQALMTILFGFLGLMVAVPMMAATIVLVRMLYVEPDPIPPPTIPTLTPAAGSVAASA
jgi:predicted PurR-regulated permease PerM